MIYKFYHGQLYLLQIFFQKLYSLGPVLKIFNTRRINNLGLLNNTEVLRVKTKKNYIINIFQCWSNWSHNFSPTRWWYCKHAILLCRMPGECRHNCSWCCSPWNKKYTKIFFSTLRDYMYQLYHDLQTSLITTGMTIIVIIVLWMNK